MKATNELTSAMIATAMIATAMMMASVAAYAYDGISSVANAQAQQPSSGNKMGTIASIQNGPDGKPGWVTSGVWDFKNVNSSSPMFNATFNMFKLDGSAPHKHTITDFKINGSPTKNNMTATYNGTVTISLKDGPAKDVPISIKLMDKSAVSIWLDPNKVKNHFGNTPLYGAQNIIR
jgi:uncharacterized membrane protein